MKTQRKENHDDNYYHNFFSWGLHDEFIVSLK